MSPRRTLDRENVSILLVLVVFASVSHAASGEAGSEPSGASTRNDINRVVQGAFIGAGLALITTGCLLDDAVGGDSRYYTNDSGDRIEVVVEPDTTSRGFFIAGAISIGLGLIYELLPSSGTNADEHVSMAPDSDAAGIRIASVAVGESNAGIALVGGF
jgi:hypothetical protein